MENRKTIEANRFVYELSEESPKVGEYYLGEEGYPVMRVSNYDSNYINDRAIIASDNPKITKKGLPALTTPTISGEENHIHVPLSSVKGHATFTKSPSTELLGLINSMAEKAYDTVVPDIKNPDSRRIMMKQSQPYGCGVYAVANAFNMPHFVTLERLEKSKECGNRIGQLSKWIQDDGHPFYIETLYYSNWEGKLPQTEFGYKTYEDCISMPLLFCVMYAKGGKNHMVGGKIFHDGTLYLYDSLKPEMIETTIEGLNDLYESVYGIYYIAHLDTADFVVLS